MRIALIASSLRLAGAEKQFSYMARALSEAEIDSHVFYLGAGDYYHSVLTDAGIPVRQIFNPGKSFLMLIRLIRDLAALKPDVVLASQFGDLIFAGLAGRISRSLVLGGVRSDGFYEVRTSGRRSSLMLKFSHGLIANSHRAKDNLASLGIKPQKIAVAVMLLDKTVSFRRAHDKPRMQDPAAMRERGKVNLVYDEEPRQTSAGAHHHRRDRADRRQPAYGACFSRARHAAESDDAR